MCCKTVLARPAEYRETWQNSQIKVNRIYVTQNTIECHPAHFYCFRVVNEFHAHCQKSFEYWGALPEKCYNATAKCDAPPPAAAGIRSSHVADTEYVGGGVVT